MSINIATPKNAYSHLNEMCKTKGVSLHSVCLEAKVNRSLLEKWKRKNPKTIEIYFALLEAVARMGDNEATANDNPVSEATANERAISEDDSPFV